MPFYNVGGGGAPAVHAATHASGGTDPVSPSSIGALSAVAANSFALATTPALRTRVTGDAFDRLQVTSEGRRFSGNGTVAPALSGFTSATNAAWGTNALSSLTTGGNSIGFGTNALSSLTTGSNVTGVGSNALLSLTTGSLSIGFGSNAGYAPGGLVANGSTTANRQVLIGAETGQATSTRADDITCIGYRAVAGLGGSVAIGSTAQSLHADSVALGYATVTNGPNQVAVGSRDVEHGATGFGPVIRSPNATRWRITVDNLGALAAVAA